MRFLLFILVVIPHCVSGQSDIWREYSEINEFCGYSLNLYNDSSYLYETGCEGASNVNFGKWYITNDTIQLIPFDTVFFSNLITITDTLSSADDSMVIISVVDMNNQPIENFRLVIIPHEVDHYWVHTPKICVVTYSEDEEIVIKAMDTDKSGNVTVHTSEIGYIWLLDFYQFNKKIELFETTTSQPRNIVIKLNLHKDVFMYNEAKWIQLPSGIISNEPKELKWIK